MKLGSTTGRNIEGSRLKCDGHFTRPPAPGSFSPRGLVFLEGRSDVFVQKDQRLPTSDDPHQRLIDFGVDHRPGEIRDPLDRLLRCHFFLIRA